MFLVTWTSSSWRGTLGTLNVSSSANGYRESSHLEAFTFPAFSAFSAFPSAQAAAFEETVLKAKTIQDSEPNYMVQTVLKAKTQ